MTKVEELIQKVKDGKVAILNDGTIEQLREVLGWCFPNVAKEKISGVSKFYERSFLFYSGFCSNDIINLPTVSVKEFYEDEVREEYPIGVIVEDVAKMSVRANAPTNKLHKKPDGKYYPYSFVQEGFSIDADIIESDKKRWKIIQPQFANTPKKEDEFVWGEEVEVSDDNKDWSTRFYVGKNPKSNEHITTTDYGRIYAWLYIRKLPLKTKLTHQMIADKFGVVLGTFEIIN